jgi:hypothetical protein
MIPNNIILTYKNDKIPKYVFDNIKLLNPEKNILFFTDEDVVKFLLKEYDSSYVDFFHGVKLGCTKGDFFRYCYLLKFGGYYCDVDIKHVEPIDHYTADNLEFFSVNSAIGPMTFQALLYCESEHPIILDCIKDIMNPETAKDLFYQTTEHMYKNIKKYLDITSMIQPTVYMINNKAIQIAQEYQLNSTYVCIYGNKIIALSRYPEYQREVGFI